MTHHGGFAPVIVASSMQNGSQYASTCTPSTIRLHTSDWYICTHCDTSHDDSAHPGVTTHNVMVDDSNTHDGAFPSPTVLEDSSTNDSATHSLVVPSVCDQYEITDPTSYDSIRKYSTQYPTDMSSTTGPNTYTVTDPVLVPGTLFINGWSGWWLVAGTSGIPG